MQGDYYDEYGNLIRANEGWDGNVHQGVTDDPWIPPNASFDPANPSGVINNQNPLANPDMRFVQEGNTGGYLEGIGVTRGEGQSDTEASAKRDYDAAIAGGMDPNFAANWLARNPGDENRLWEVWQDELNPGGWDPSNGPEPGGSRSGGGGGQSFADMTRGLDPPGAWNFRDYTPTGWTQPGAFQAPTWSEEAYGIGKFDAPEWNEPGAWQQPGAFQGPTFQEPAPWTYAEFTKPTLEEAKNEPGYEFAMQQGQKALESSAAARGTLNTGGTLMDLIGYGQRMGEQNYSNVFNRSQNVWAGNRDLSKSIWDTEYGVTKDKYSADYTKAKDEYDKAYAASKEGYDRGYLSSREAYDRDYLAAKDEYDKNYAASQGRYEADYAKARDEYDKSYTASRDAYEAMSEREKQAYDYDREESQKSYEMAYNVWLQKMRTATDIFNEGSD